MFNLNDDAVAGADQRQPFHIVNGKVLTQQEWNTYVHGGDDEI